MRLALDGRALCGPNTGDRTYWLSLVRALRRIRPDWEITVLTRIPIPPATASRLEGATIRTVYAVSDRVWTLFTLPRIVAHGYDLMHTQYTTPLRCDVPAVTTVHDISFRLHPNLFPLKHRLLLNSSVPPSMRRAAHVITDSYASRYDIIRAYGLPENKVTAIWLAHDESFSPQQQENDRALVNQWVRTEAPYVLAVGVLQPRKNLPLLVETFGVARRRADLPHRLVLVGKSGWNMASIHEVIRRYQMSDRVIFTGYLPDEVLPSLYRLADLFVFPSKYEGFGLPPLEAMACGVPTIASDAPAMSEVIASGGRLVDPYDSSAWSDAIVEALQNRQLRQEMSQKAIERATVFSWQKTALHTVEVYERVIGKVRGLSDD